ncbi:unnamed protein product, partial [Didymodactylos carnosus]
RDPQLSTGKLSRGQSRVCSPLPIHNHSTPSSLLPIVISGDEEEKRDTMDKEQEQFEDDNKEQLEAFNTSFQTTKQMEKQLLNKIPQLKNPAVGPEEVSQWLNKAVINNNWENFQTQLIQHLTSPEDQNGNTTQITTHHSTIRTILREGSENDEKAFDDFLRNNFTKFSEGETEDPETWLLEILTTFESLKILESEWLSYVSALLILKARLWYGKHKSKFNDFDNFVEKFTLEFRPIERIASNHTPTTTSTSDHTTTKKHPIEFSVIKTCSEQVVKNLKKFSGKKEENVMRWLDDMQVQFDANSWSDEIKLTILPIVLVDNALKWYARNSTSLTSWKMFFQLIK